MITRPAQVEDAPGMAHVHIRSWQTTYRGIIADETLDNLSVERRENWWAERVKINQDIIYVAERAGQVVGFASAGPNRDEPVAYSSELYAIYLLQDAQRLGLGQQMVRAIAQNLQMKGFESMAVWVLRDNLKARRFYEALGGRYVTEKQITIGTQSLYEVAYGWESISDLTPKRPEQID